MTKISVYNIDEYVTADDKWIGTDVNTYNKTKNFTPRKLSNYFNGSQVINTGVDLLYKYFTITPPETRPTGTLSFETEIGPTVNFSTISTFLLSNTTLKGNYIVEFFDFLVGKNVLLYKAKNINLFGNYNIVSVEEYLPDPNFFVVNVEFIEGNGFIEEDEDYMISLISGLEEQGLQDVVNIGNSISNYGGIGTASIQSTNFSNNRTLYLNNNAYPTIKLEDNLNSNHYTVIDIDTLNLSGVSYPWSSIVGGTQNLQEVTDEGSITTNSITIDSLNYYSLISPDAIGTENKTTGAYAFLGADGVLGLKNGTVDSILKNTNATNNNIVLEFPDKPTGSYTIATTSDVIVQNLQEVTDIGATTDNTITINPTIDTTGLNINIPFGDGTGLIVNGNKDSGSQYGILSNGGSTGFRANNNEYGLSISSASVVGIDITSPGGDLGIGIYQNYGVAILSNLGIESKGIVINSGTSSTGNFIELNKNGVDKLVINQDGTLTINSTDNGINIENAGSAGIVITNPVDVGLILSNPGSGGIDINTPNGNFGIRSTINYGTNIELNLGFGADGIIIESGTSSTGIPFQVSKNSVAKAFIDQAGELTAQKLIKQGGTSSQILAANGSVITAGSNITISGGTISANGGGSVTSVTATSPITSSGGTTPVISTSMATNKLIGRSTSGTGVMEEITVGSGLTLSAGTLTNTATPTPTGYYGAFQDLLTQTLTTANVGQPFLIRTVDESNQVNITTNGSGQLTRITPLNTGTYNIQWSGQFQNPDNAIHDINVWFRRGLTSSSGPGTDIVGSNGIVALPARKSASAGEQGHVVAGWNFLLTIAAGEYVEFYWMSTSTQVTLQAYSAGSPPPSTASLIVTVTQQSGIMAGTGITALGTSGNSQTGATQILETNGSGTDFNIVSSGNTHTFNLPTASATNRGALSSANWTTFNNKQSSSTNLTSLSGLTYSTPAFVKMTSTGTFTLDTSGGGSTYTFSSPLVTTGTVISLPAANATTNGYLSTSAQAIAGIKTFSASPLAPTPATGLSDTTLATTAFVTNSINAATPGTGYTVYNILIASTANITTQTTGTSGGVSYVQNGRNVMINNSATAITVDTTSAVTDFIASYTKIGTANITFIGTGITFVNAINGVVLSGLPGSTALLVKNGSNVYLSINNLVI